MTVLLLVPHGKRLLSLLHLLSDKYASLFSFFALYIASLFCKKNMYKFGNLEQYHGTGAALFNLHESSDEKAAAGVDEEDWDTMLLDLLHRPNDKVIVAARRRGRGHGGWSKNNPHLEDRFVEFEIDIEPASLVTRIVSVRNQIAMEWAKSDLDLLDRVTQMILQSYHEHQNAQRQAEVEQEKECINFEGDNDSAIESSVAGAVSVEDGDCVSIESLTAPYTGGSSSGVSSGGVVASSRVNRDPLSLNSLTRDNAYDRIAMEFLNNKMLSDDEMGSSPQRKGNFDLLTLLATQEAVHRVLRGYQDDPSHEREVSLTWLREFYIPRIPIYFDGDGKYSRADDFLQELLLTPPMTKRIVDDDDEKSSTSSKRIAMALIDPLRIAEDILQQRSLVAKEWKEIMQHQVPSDHMKLQREILTVRMSPPPPPPQEQRAVDSASSSSNTLGQFE
jgi:hypothetical protein